MLYEVITRMDQPHPLGVAAAGQGIEKKPEPSEKSPGTPGLLVGQNAERGLAHTGPDHVTRITSYNVCYTKLLRDNKSRFSACHCRFLRAGGGNLEVFHYGWLIPFGADN